MEIIALGRNKWRNEPYELQGSCRGLCRLSITYARASKEDAIAYIRG